MQDRAPYRLSGSPILPIGSGSFDPSLMVPVDPDTNIMDGILENPYQQEPAASLMHPQTVAAFSLSGGPAAAGISSGLSPTANEAAASPQVIQEEEEIWDPFSCPAEDPSPASVNDKKECYGSKPEPAAALSLPDRRALGQPPEQPLWGATTTQHPGNNQATSPRQQQQDKAILVPTPAFDPQAPKAKPAGEGAVSLTSKKRLTVLDLGLQQQLPQQATPSKTTEAVAFHPFGQQPVTGRSPMQLPFPIRTSAPFPLLLGESTAPPFLIPVLPARSTFQGAGEDKIS